MTLMQVTLMVGEWDTRRRAQLRLTEERISQGEENPEAVNGCLGLDNCHIGL